MTPTTIICSLDEESDVDSIQQETFELGKTETIKEIENILSQLYVNDLSVTDLFHAMTKELNQLKESRNDR